MRNIIHIAAKDLRLRVRDKSVFIIGLIAPLALAFIFNTVFGGAFGDDGTFAPDLGIVETDADQTNSTLEQISSQLGGTWQSFADPSAAEAALDEGDVGAVFVVPDNFDAELAGGQIGDIEVLGAIDAVTSTQIAAGIARNYTNSLQTTQVAIASAISAGGNPADIVPAAIDATDRSLISLGEVNADVRQLDSNTSTVAGMAMFFLLFTAQTGLLSLLEERRDGTLQRILSTPTRPASVLAAKSIVSIILGVFSLVVLIVAGIVLMDANWGNPLGVALLVIGGVLAAVGISAVTTGMAKTPEQAGNIQGIVATVLGLLGGAFFPIGQDGGILAQVTALTPHYWFSRGLADLAGGQPASAAFGAVGWLLVIASVTSVLAAVLTRKHVAP
ncbi:MAG TPA: ABC transporter permease [Acidimicrobiia bacterium]|nr:ABC transporter permease [Acidimicrobiia bacterium]